MSMFYFEQGKTFDFGGKIFKVQKAKKRMDCEGCFFNDIDDFNCNIFACLDIDRKDKSSIIFVDTSAEQ